MERDFKGVWISSEIWLNPQLTAQDKVIFAEINSLDVGDKGCYASNEYLAEFCGCSVPTVSRSISKLIELGLLEISSFDGRTRIMKVCLIKLIRQTNQNDKSDLSKRYYSNIKDNTIREKHNNKYPTLEEVKSYCQERNNNVDAERWYDYYSANGFKVGKNPMKDWKAAVRTWERNEFNPKTPEKEKGYDLKEVEQWW